MRLYFAVAVLLMLFPIQASHSQAGPTFNLKLSDSHSFLSDSQKVNLIEKDPWAAGLQSFIIPGLALGQFYNDQKMKAFIHIAISAGLIMFAITYADMTDAQIKGPVDGHNGKGSGVIAIAALAYACNWIWSVVDAVISAKNINKQVRLQKYRSDVLDKLKFGFTVNKNKQFNLKFAIDL